MKPVKKQRKENEMTDFRLEKEAFDIKSFNSLPDGMGDIPDTHYTLSHSGGKHQ